MYENETYFDRTTYSEEELRKQSPPYDKKADRAARKAAKAAQKAEKAEKTAGRRGGIARKVALCICLGLCFGVFAGLGFYGVMLGTGQLSQADSANMVNMPSYDSWAAEQEEIVVPRYITYTESDLSDVVEEVMPAMVSIVNNFTSTGMNFWGQTYRRSGVSSGSGIIVGKTDTELLIATNNHVVEGTDSLEITFIDDSTAEAVIKGTNTDMDIAVVAVPVSELSPETLDAISVAKLGDSDSLKMGMPVIAIGNALGYGQSVTNGIISALDREMTSEDGSTGRYIQTNAAINHGNSGGALLNISGEVIGINVARIDDDATYSVEAMGYAIPISAAMPIIEELMERETRTVKVPEEEKGYMGIRMENVTDDEVERFGIPKGVYAREVVRGSAAEAAGIRRGDIIVKLDGQKVSSDSDIQKLMQYYRAGETLKVTLERFDNGEYVTKEVEVILGQRPRE